MANNTISQVEINGTPYDLLDANTLSAVSALDQRVTALEGFNQWKYAHLTIDSITINASGFVQITPSLYPAGWYIVVLENYGSITPKAAISICGRYLIGAPNTTVTGLELGFLCLDTGTN